MDLWDSSKPFSLDEENLGLEKIVSYPGSYSWQVTEFGSLFSNS